MVKIQRYRGNIRRILSSYERIGNIGYYSVQYSLFFYGFLKVLLHIWEKFSGYFRAGILYGEVLYFLNGNIPSGRAYKMVILG